MLWDLAGARTPAKAVPHDSLVNQAAFSPTSPSVMTLSLDGTAILWELATGEPTRSVLTYLTSTRHADFSADGGRVATAHDDGTARIWDLTGGSLVCAPLRHEGPVNHVEFSRDNRFLVTASGDGFARSWEAASGRLISQMNHTGAVAYASFTPDGSRIVTAMVNRPDQLVTLWADGTTDGRNGMIASTAQVQVWDRATGQPVSRPLRFNTPVSMFAFSPDRRLIVPACAQGNGGPVAVWDVLLGHRVTLPFEQNAGAFSAAFSPDGKRVVTAGSDESARVWDATTGSLLMVPLTHSRRVFHAAFSADGRFVVTASENMRARVWDASTGEPVTPPLFRMNSRVFNRAFFSLNGQYLVLATGASFAQSLELRKAAHPVGDALSLATLVAGHRVDEMGGLVPLKPEETEVAWQNLKRKYPGDFAASREQNAGWLRDETDSHYRRGLVYVQSNQWRQASEEFSKAIGLNADDRDASNNVAYATEKPLPLALGSVQIARGSRIELWLGLAYYRCGQFNKAVENLEKVKADKNGATAVVFFYLAMGCKQLGDSVKAEEYFAKANTWRKSENLPLQELRAEAEEVLGKSKTK